MTITTTASPWDGARVRIWLAARIIASRAEQVRAQRGGYREQDDCDKATAEEMVCTLLQGQNSADDPAAFAADLRALLDRDDYSWRGVYDDTRFERHVRTYLRKLIKMTKTNEGFERTGRFQ
jgi:hypothetical protein